MPQLGIQLLAETETISGRLAVLHLVCEFTKTSGWSFGSPGAWTSAWAFLANGSQIREPLVWATQAQVLESQENLRGTVVAGAGS
jgi:hypothetical protein